MSRHQLPFTLRADSEKKVARDDGVLHRMLGLIELARRETFIVDPDGRAAKHYREVDPGSHSKQVLADLQGAAGPGAEPDPSGRPLREAGVCGAERVTGRFSSRIAPSSPASVSGNIRSPISSRVICTDGV